MVAISALFLAGALAVNIAALRAGLPWVGVNYWNQPIDTYGQFVVLVFLIGFGAYWLVRNWRWWI